MSWKIIGRHKWIVGTVVTESVNDDDSERRYTATVRGYRNWKLFEGELFPCYLQLIIRVVRAIRDQIDEDGEGCEAFKAANEYSHDATELWRKVEIFEHPNRIPAEGAFDIFLEAGKVYPDPARQGKEER